MGGRHYERGPTGRWKRRGSHEKPWERGVTFLQCELSNLQKWRRLPSLTGSCHRTGHREALSREEESQRPGLAELSSLHEVHGVKSCVALTFSQCALPDDHVDFCVCLTWSSGMRRSQTPGHLAVIFTLKGLLWFAYGWLISSQHLCFNLTVMGAGFGRSFQKVVRL